MPLLVWFLDISGFLSSPHWIETPPAYSSIQTKFPHIAQNFVHCFDRYQTFFFSVQSTSVKDVGQGNRFPYDAAWAIDYAINHSQIVTPECLFPKAVVPHFRSFTVMLQRASSSLSMPTYSLSFPSSTATSPFLSTISALEAHGAHRQTE